MIDAKTWEFKLRQGVLFHDGTPLTAEDVVFSIKRAMAPTSEFKGYIPTVVDAKGPDSHTVHILTSGPNPIMPDQLSNIFIMSKKWCEKHNAVQPPGVHGFPKDLDKNRPPYDPEKAKKLLAEAGYPNGFEVALDVPNDRYNNDEAIDQATVGMLGKIGIKVKLGSQSKSLHFPKISKRTSDFYMLGWGCRFRVYGKGPFRGKIPQPHADDFPGPLCQPRSALAGF